MPLARGRSSGLMTGGGGGEGRGEEGVGRSSFLMSRGLGGRSPGLISRGIPLPRHVSHDAFDVTYPHPWTDRCL